MPEKPTDLAALLAEPPRALLLRRDLDSASAVVPRQPLIQRWGLAAKEPGPDDLGLGSLLTLVLGAGSLVLTRGCEEATDKAAWLALSATNLVIAWVVIGIAWAIWRILGHGGPCRIALTAQRVEIRDGARAWSFDLETILDAGFHGWGPEIPPADDGPGELELATTQGRRRLLRGVRIESLRWIAAVLRAAAAERRRALRAQGHAMAELGEPPPEALALQELADRAADRPRGRG